MRAAVASIDIEFQSCGGDSQLNRILKNMRPRGTTFLSSGVGGSFDRSAARGPAASESSSEEAIVAAEQTRRGR